MKQVMALLMAVMLLAGCSSPASLQHESEDTLSGKSFSKATDKDFSRPANKISRDGQVKAQTIELKTTKAGGSKRYWCDECQQYESLDDYDDYDDYEYYEDCDECDGSGYDNYDEYCEECDGYGYIDYDYNEEDAPDGNNGIANPSVSPVPVPVVSGAAKTAAEFTSKYGVTFTDPNNLYKNAKYSDMMDRVMSSYSPKLISAMAAIFKKNGMNMVVEIRNATAESKREGLDGEAFTDGKQAKFVIYAPSGMTDGIITHEFGHLVHYALEYKISADKLQKEWVSLNKGAPYNENYTSADKFIFADEYGSTDFYEDVASSFEVLAENPANLNKYKTDAAYSAIWGKFKLLKSWCETNLSSPIPLLAAAA